MVSRYKAIKKWRYEKMKDVCTNHFELNALHDEVMKRTVHESIRKVEGEWGCAPAPFAFFLMGSAGRFEQSIWSDQDHGIIYQGEMKHQSYFLALGEEIKNGLVEVGYEECDGKVMSSNPLWCQSRIDWKGQIMSWLEEASWQSLRHFSTFFDSRVLIGSDDYLEELKQCAFLIIRENPRLYKRFIDNVDFIKKGVGVFGQLLPELHGEQSGSIHLKKTVFFPYVNALRLLALKEEITSPSTLSRFETLPEQMYVLIGKYEQDFMKLLAFRLRSRKDARNYKEVHHIPLHTLTKEEKHELKLLMKTGYKLFSETKAILEKECSTW
ncbi:DUF294 nucleotidyltransferase-like domain-containing protein [Radiobacillus kanasensis]|uniref:DUF294 nucleotidyltransferase-like domain-containing protein n=1 Tax=Radiobacillus kanasensis TaxID=2844358 RepID=UPI001E36DED9|nr:DUF294 nucleotidyltransferase-like domain-containing protein [Radiobacillus kanasensis]UFT99658.1 DUF294 nucleotidyltransferase-like domain-containing protein [Radiobacillus kanasensis]